MRKAPGRGCVQVATVDAGGAGGDAGPVARSPGAFSVMAVGMLVVGWALWRIPVVAWYGTDPSDQLDAARNAQP
jgi:hypothetical protein